MNARPTSLSNILCSVALFAACLLWVGPAVAQAQLLFSYETDLQGWGASGFTGSDFISVATSTMGATEGLQSMAVETGPTFGWDVNANVGTGDTTGVYDAFNTVAGNPLEYTLDFDVTITPDSFANVSNPGSLFLINVSTNDDANLFPQVSNVTPNLQGLTGTFQVSIPMTSLPLVEASTFYQLNIGSNSDHMNGGGGEGVKYFVDNIRFTQIPDFTEDTLFSWETPDDSGTPGVNEQLEGWGESFQVGHAHSISTTGATDGSSAMEITRTIIPPAFTWGSEYRISSSVAPDPNDLEADFDESVSVDGKDFLDWQRNAGTMGGASKVDGDANGDGDVNEIDLGIWNSEYGNAASTDAGIQATIDDLVSRIEGADKIAFDVTYDDPGLNAGQPTFLKFTLHFTDASGVFYQKSSDDLGAPVADETTVTVVLDLDDFVDTNGSGKILGVDGFVEDTNFLRIGLASNTNDSRMDPTPPPEYFYQIDNFRLLTEVSPAALATVPEPSVGLLGCVGAILLLAGRRSTGLVN